MIVDKFYNLLDLPITACEFIGTIEELGLTLSVRLPKTSDNNNTGDIVYFMNVLYVINKKKELSDEVEYILKLSQNMCIDLDDNISLLSSSEEYNGTRPAVVKILEFDDYATLAALLEDTTEFIGFLRLHDVPSMCAYHIKYFFMIFMVSNVVDNYIHFDNISLKLKVRDGQN